MRSRLPAKSGAHPLTLAVMGFLVLLIGGAGTVAVLAYFGVVDLGALLGRRHTDSYKGLIAIPVSSRPVYAFSKVEREDLADYPHNLPVLFIYRKADEVDKRWITDYNQIINRVMARDKAPGVFTESDFKPRGTRPGIAAGVPVGKRAMVLDASQIRGLDELRVGDHFDLLASEEVDFQGLQPQVRDGSAGKSLLKGAAGAAGSGHKARVMVLVNNGVLVTRPHVAAPVAQPNGNSAMNQLTGAGAPSRKNEPKEMAIAVSPEEITSLTEALTAKKSIYCVARSGLPDEKLHETRVPEEDPLKSVSRIETIRGHKFGSEAFAATDGQPAVTSDADKPLPTAVKAPAAVEKSSPAVVKAPIAKHPVPPDDEPNIGLPPADPDD